jgi:hypothetical protein
MPYRYLLAHLADEAYREKGKGQKRASANTNEELGIFEDVFHRIESIFGPRPYAMAPVRTKPQRTYDPVKASPTPEGDHVPFVLTKTYFGDQSQWDQLRVALDEFGKSAGLFEDVTIKTLGKHESDPFQIRVKVAGPSSNLIDVGYGVSQALPIIVDILTNGYSRWFLIQQPEVHLHPKAQAELGTYLGLLVQRQGKNFVLETHSDHLIDRIRMDVRDRKTVKPSDVSILFFERNGSHVDIHPIRLDEQGNLLDAPATYREFFLIEERRFLGL